MQGEHSSIPSPQAPSSVPGGTPAVRIYHGIPRTRRVFPNEVTEPPAPPEPLALF